MKADTLKHWTAIFISSMGFAIAVRYGTFVPWGTDSAGYIESAHRWATGELVAPSPLSLGPAWAGDGTAVAPLSFRPGLESGTDVNMYPLGYPVLMAAAIRMGGDLAEYLVVPVCTAVLVMSTYWIATSIAGTWAGLLAAALIGLSPVTLVSAVQPLSDVPATAFWILAWAMSLRPGLGASAAAGVATAMAVMMRPNLAPLGVVPAWLQCAGPGVSGSFAQTLPRLLTFAGTAALGPGFVWWSQAALYGHYLAPGSPGWEQFYQLAHVRQNLSIYPRFLTTVHSPLVLAGLLTPLWARRSRAGSVYDATVAWSAVAVVLLTFALYLPYLHYEDLHYVRFMLPAITALFALLAVTVVLVGRALTRTSRWLGALALVPAVYVAAAPMPLFDYMRTMADGQRRVVLIGRYLEEVLPQNAVVLSYLQTGALAHYTRRPVVRYDLIAGTQLDVVVADLVRRGYRPVIVLDEMSEVPEFRTKFARSPIAQLNWKPRARARDAVSSIVYLDPADRAAAARSDTWAVDVLTADSSPPTRR